MSKRALGAGGPHLALGAPYLEEMWETSLIASPTPQPSHPTSAPPTPS
jgi:hypothetical protein